MSSALRARHTNLAKALSHPVRVQALEIMGQRVASARDVAEALDVPLAKARYHLNTLLRLECIEAVEPREAGTAADQRYRATTRAHVDLGEWAAMPRVARQAFAATVAGNAFDDLRGALTSDDLFERDDVHISWTRLALDEEGWARIYGQLDAILQEAFAEQAASVERLRTSGEDAILATLSLFQHKSSPPRPDAAAGR